MKARINSKVYKFTAKLPGAISLFFRNPNSLTIQSRVVSDPKTA